MAVFRDRDGEGLQLFQFFERREVGRVRVVEVQLSQIGQAAQCIDLLDLIPAQIQLFQTSESLKGGDIRDSRILTGTIVGIGRAQVQFFQIPGVCGHKVFAVIIHDLAHPEFQDRIAPGDVLYTVSGGGAGGAGSMHESGRKDTKQDEDCCHKQDGNDLCVRCGPLRGFFPRFRNE